MQTQVFYGPRLGREGELRTGCSAIIFDEKRERVLLTRRSDNGHWCLPGGGMVSGESAAEACEREVLEETGLRIRVDRLTGVYSNPDQLIIYPDGKKVFMVVLSFEAQIVEGEPILTEETTAFGYFSLKEMESLPMHAKHLERVRDAMTSREPWIK